MPCFTGWRPLQGPAYRPSCKNSRRPLYSTPTAPNATGPVPVQQSSGSTQVGPYTSAYELFARFETGDTAGALALIRNEWGLMRKSSPYYSGATWEYVALDGTPGLGVGTSTLGTVGVPIGGIAGTLIVNGHSAKSETTVSETGAGRAGYAYVRDLAPGTYRIVTSPVSR
jgi:hypothetical protein